MTEKKETGKITMPRFAEVALSMELASKSALQGALHEQQRQKKLGNKLHIGEILVSWGVLSNQQVEKVLQKRAAQIAKLSEIEENRQKAALADTAAVAIRTPDELPGADRSEQELVSLPGPDPEPLPASEPESPGEPVPEPEPEQQPEQKPEQKPESDPEDDQTRVIDSRRKAARKPTARLKAPGKPALRGMKTRKLAAPGKRPGTDAHRRFGKSDEPEKANRKTKKKSPSRKSQLGALAVVEGFLSEDQLGQILIHQKQLSDRGQIHKLGEILVACKILKEEDVEDLLYLQKHPGSGHQHQMNRATRLAMIWITVVILVLVGTAVMHSMLKSDKQPDEATSTEVEDATDPAPDSATE